MMSKYWEVLVTEVVLTNRFVSILLPLLIIAISMVTKQ